MFSRRLAVAVLLLALPVLSACTPTGSIVILENYAGTEFTMNPSKFTGAHKCQLSLSAGDVLQIEVVRKSGKMALVISGVNGSEPYAGSDLPSRTFTVGIAETDEYVFRISGEAATGKIAVKNLGQKDRREP
ncbi:MAG: hypothetical protein ACOX48_06105 [Limnochordia bacterium]|jgi:hypothetical protein